MTGHTRSAYDPDRDSGGSSAGSGAAVAANLCLVAIGEDTGGSIRIPGSFNNCYGMRVTTGLVREPASPLWCTSKTRPDPWREPLTTSGSCSA